MGQNLVGFASRGGVENLGGDHQLVGPVLGNEIGQAFGNGSAVTDDGAAMLEAYRRIEAAAEKALEREMKLFGGAGKAKVKA